MVSEVTGADQLFRRHASYVKAFLLRLGISTFWVDDTVQDVFIVVHACGGYRPGPATERTWLGSIAIRVAANARRKRNNYNKYIIEDSSELLKHYPAEAHPLDVNRVLHELDSVDREVLLRFYLHGEDGEAIASALNTPVGTIYRKLHDSRKRFIALLSHKDE
jgi:RNA polymerase sigma-70 factor (ECF subfamily)